MADSPRIEDLRRRVQKDPASIAFAQLAEEYRRAGQLRESVDACRAGLSLHPGYLSARVTLGRVLLELGEFDAAERELQTVLKTAPENLAAVRGTADIYYRRGALEPALEFYRRALGLARNDPELEQIVADLAKRIAPSPRAESRDGLSFEQVQREISARVPASTPTPAPEKARRQDSVVRKPAAAPPLAQGFRLTSTPNASRAARPPSDAAVGTASAAEARPEPAAAAPSDPAGHRAVRTVAALEQWLDALHVARASRAS
jgi:tetratricopeptide (TPR) repeat protein